MTPPKSGWATLSRLYYERWYCGHWHISKRGDKLHFLFHDFEIAEE